MKCPFCHYAMKDLYGDIWLTCSACPPDANIALLVSKIEHSNALWIRIKTDNYNITIDGENKTTDIFQVAPFDSSMEKLILQLPYIADVNPHNAIEWLQRVLKLKAFF